MKHAKPYRRARGLNRTSKRIVSLLLILLSLAAIAFALHSILSGEEGGEPAGGGQAAGGAGGGQTEPDDAPPPVEEPPADIVATLGVLGDTMSHSQQTADAKQAAGTYDYRPMLRYARDLTSRPSYTIANLETTLAGEPYTGFPYFSAPDALAEAAYDAGIDLFSTANNHGLDYRHTGLTRTLDVLDRIGLAHVGTYRTAEERAQSGGVLVADVGGISIAFVSISYGTNAIPIPEDKPWSINVYNHDYMTNLVDPNYEFLEEYMAAARDKGADLIAVLAHWGNEYRHYPNEYQKGMADFLFEQGADLILGNHPHVLQPMEMREIEGEDGRVRQGFLSYSMGNFISAQVKDNTNITAMLELELTKQGETGEVTITNVSYHPMYMLDRGEGASGGRYFILDAHSAIASFEQNGSDGVLTESVVSKLKGAIALCHEVLGPEADAGS